MPVDPSKFPDATEGSSSDEEQITKELLATQAANLTTTDETDLLAMVYQALNDIRTGQTATVSSDEQALITLIQGTAAYAAIGTAADSATHEGNYLGGGDY